MTTSTTLYKINPSTMSSATALQIITLMEAMPAYFSPATYESLPEDCQNLLMQFQYEYLGPPSENQ